MTDKNFIKEQFRAWAMAHKNVSEEEARVFIWSLVPVSERKSYVWLVDDCVTWFRWLKDRYKHAPTLWLSDDEPDVCHRLF